MESRSSLLTTPVAILLGAFVISVAILIHGGIIKIGNVAVKPQAPQVAQAPQAPAETTSATISIDDDPVLGDKNAPVTLIEFSDYECPFCKRHFDQVYPEIKKDYIDTGKVKLVYRDYPLDFHPNAQKAAEASECAHAQGKFWEMHDKLFENQASLSIDNYKTWAKDLGLDTAKFNDCLDKGTYADEVKKDLADGQAAGVSGTPGFFVNHQIISGAVPYAVFKTTIDAELGAK